MIPQVDTIYIWDRYGVESLTSEKKRKKIRIAQDKNWKFIIAMQGANSIQFDIIEKMDLSLMSKAYETSHWIKGIAHWLQTYIKWSVRKNQDGTEIQSSAVLYFGEFKRNE